MSEEFAVLTPAARRKVLLQIVVLAVAALVILWTVAYHADALNPCERRPWLLGMRLSFIFCGVLGALMGTRWAYKLIRTGQMPLPGVLPSHDKRIKRGRPVYFFAGFVLVCTGLIMFIVGLDTGAILDNYQVTEHLECAAK